MEIHNITEDAVLSTVDEIFSTIEKDGKADRPCTCAQCRLDVACYVLNRSVPRYMVSSRGVAHSESEDLGRQQEEADIVSLVHEGIARVAKARRPQFEHKGGRLDEAVVVEGPAFNIPTIIGRIFNGLNFEPLSDIEITLYKDSERAEMIGPSWQNPYRMVANTAGNFSFWPKPDKADQSGLPRTYRFEIVASLAGFEDTRHFFELEVSSEAVAAGSFSMQRTCKLPDLYLFPPDSEEDK